MVLPSADLVIVFRSVAKTKQETTEVEHQYNQLLNTLRTKGGLKAVGKRGSKDGQALVFVSVPEEKLVQLVQKERYADFLNGVPSSALPSVTRDFSVEPLSPADRIRMASSYVTGSVLDGGLGIASGIQEWSRVESIMALHDKQFNESWLSTWVTKKVGLSVGDEELQRIKNQFGESVALYFAFISFYTKSLIFPAALGIAFYFFSTPYHPLYSIILCIWSVTFVEWWRLYQQALAVRWGTYHHARVEVRRAEFKGKGDSTDEQDDSAFPWWKREGRVIASLPVIGFFAVLLTGLLTSIFVVEAFMTQFYHGPGVQYVGLVPTALFITLVPRLVGFYQSYAQSLTTWENHIHKSGHEKSLTLKTFAMSAIVAYGGLYLTAFVYVPFGQNVMTWVQRTFFADHPSYHQSATDEKMQAAADPSIRKPSLNPDRLRTQVFTYLVTNQAVGAFLEIGLPFIMKTADKAKAAKKKVGPPSEKGHLSVEESRFLEDARSQAALPEYNLFGDYSEMVTQFGYCVLWSPCWSLAPTMALINNWLESRSDAFKIAHQARRPIPSRTDSIGPWLETLGFLTWQGALTNSALIYLFRDSAHHASSFKQHPTTAQSVTTTLHSAIFPALLIALSTSHAFILVRALVKHILVRAVWRGSEEDLKLIRSEKEIKRQWLAQVGQVDGEGIVSAAKSAVREGTHVGVPDVGSGFWADDEALSDIRKGAKLQ